MSIFSSFKKGKKVADQKKAELEATKKAADDAPKEEYKHVPTHAARDAVYGSPSGWRKQDREQIKKINTQRTSMMSRESSYISQSGFPRTQSYAAEAAASQYHRSYSQPQMPGRNIRSTSYLGDNSASRMSMPGRLETRHHSFQGRYGFAANGAYTGAAQPYTPSPLATSSNSPTEETVMENGARGSSEGAKSTSSSYQEFEFGNGVEMPTQRQKQVTPPLQDHPAHRNSKRKYRESAPPSSSPYGQSKAPYVVTAQAIPPNVTEIHAPTPQRQQPGRFMQQVPAQYEQHEPNQHAQPAPVQHTQHMTTNGYLARPPAVPAPAPAGTYAFDHAPLLPSSPTTSTAVTTPPPAKKSRFSLQKFKRSPAVAAH